MYRSYAAFISWSHQYDYHTAGPLALKMICHQGCGRASRCESVSWLMMMAGFFQGVARNQNYFIFAP